MSELIAADPAATARAGLAWHRLAGTLASHAADLDRQLARPRAAPFGPPARPPDRTPAHGAAWGQGRAPPEQQWRVEPQPALIGTLDGFPAATRDLANRDRLYALLAAPAVPHRDALLAIQARLGDGYLLGLSPDGRGRAIVAFGDPDTADHVVTCVPGLGGNLDHVTDELTRIGPLAPAARHPAPAQATSVIAWLGYDAPSWLPEAALAGRAQRAEPDLHDFQTGLRLTHQGSASHN